MVSKRTKSLVSIVSLLGLVAITCGYIALIIISRDQFSTPALWMFVSLGVVAIIWLLKFGQDDLRARQKPSDTDQEQ